ENARRSARRLAFVLHGPRRVGLASRPTAPAVSKDSPEVSGSDRSTDPLSRTTKTHAPLEKGAKEGVPNVTRIPSFEASVDFGPDRIDRQRDGADCAGRLPVAHLLHPVRLRPADGGTGHVVWHLRRRAPLSRHGYRVRRVVEAVSRSRLLVLLCRAGVS